jgi:hypothetical protein
MTSVISHLGLFPNPAASKAQLYYNSESDPFDDDRLLKKIDALMADANPSEVVDIWREEVASLLSSFASTHHPDTPVVVVDSLSQLDTLEADRMIHKGAKIDRKLGGLLRQVEEEERQEEIDRQLREGMVSPGVYPDKIVNNSTFGARAAENHNAYYNDNILRAFDARVKRPRSERIPHMKRGGYRGRNR